MSSAILYVAIVAIWACVLIPRWLRRDSARDAGSTAEPAVPGDVVRGDVVPDGNTADDGGSGAGDLAGTVHARYVGSAGYEDYPDYAETVRAAEAAEDIAEAARAHGAAEDVAEPAAEAGAPPPASEGSRRRMLAARRRLLGMLILLEIAALALAMMGFAALWVLIPPSIMLIGYLLLLREAAQADTERAQREEDAARARARAQARARQRAEEHVAATPPPAPARRYEDPGPPGRDFAPGLAGKYTTSNAEVIDMYEQADEDFRDEYTVKKLRAVGD